MANLPISGLTASASNLAATDVTPVVQTTGVGPVKMTGLQFAGGLLGSTVLTGSTVTTSQPLFDLTQTWNAGAVTFSGLKLNVTDTASTAASLLMDLQVGGTSKFKVDKSGSITFNAATGTYYNVSASGDATSGYYLNNNVGGIFLGTSFDAILTRRAAANLRLGAADAAAPVPQTLSVQSVVAGTSNTTGADLIITGSQGTGTGAGGKIRIQVAPPGSAGTAQNALVDAITINSDKSVLYAGNVLGSYFQSSGNMTAGPNNLHNFLGRGGLGSTADGSYYLKNNAGTGFTSLQLGPPTASFVALKLSGTTIQTRLGDDTAFTAIQGKLTTDTAYTAGAPTVTGYITIYDSTGTAYKVAVGT